ncbi:type II toxin-antitoxin system RelE/ParE family toxin [Vitreimonas sp.]|uniref:type II toxin-antitoxin system RelE/ParE family toxin n=1 Tax=Vitreimonas sp. TaxID=3069702 RepID=UPI0039C96A60
MRALRWSKAARRDLLEIWAWRGRDRPELGDQAVDQIAPACARLRRFPFLGPPFARAAPDARKLSVGGYLALYRVEEGSIVMSV